MTQQLLYRNTFIEHHLTKLSEYISSTTKEYGASVFVQKQNLIKF